MMVDLTKQEWDMVMAILSKAPWDVANPLLMKMGAQLQEQQQAGSGALRPGNSYNVNVPKDLS